MTENHNCWYDVRFRIEQILSFKFGQLWIQIIKYSIGEAQSPKLSVHNLVWPVEQVSIIYQHQLSTSSWNENKASQVIFYQMSIPSGIDLDHCSTHPTITENKKKQFQGNWGLNLPPCPWDLSLAIDWHTNNLSHHGRASLK